MGNILSIKGGMAMRVLCVSKKGVCIGQRWHAVLASLSASAPSLRDQRKHSTFTADHGDNQLKVLAARGATIDATENTTRPLSISSLQQLQVIRSDPNISIYSSSQNLLASSTRSLPDTHSIS